MEFFTQHIDTIIFATITLILGYDRFISGAGNLRKEITADYKERNTQLEERVKEFEVKLNETNLKLAGLMATIAEKDKHIQSLTEVLQGRNPETLALLQDISTSNKEIKIFMEMMHKDSKIERKHQTDILEGQVKREIRLDTATEQGTGKPTRDTGN